MWKSNQIDKVYKYMVGDKMSSKEKLKGIFGEEKSKELFEFMNEEW